MDPQGPPGTLDLLWLIEHLVSLQFKWKHERRCLLFFFIIIILIFFLLTAGTQKRGSKAEILQQRIWFHQRPSVMCLSFSSTFYPVEMWLPHCMLLFNLPLLSLSLSVSLYPRSPSVKSHVKVISLIPITSCVWHALDLEHLASFCIHFCLWD